MVGIAGSGRGAGDHEFLPVSSDGHLLLTQNLFAWLTGVAKTGKENLFFDVILHLGTTAAILVHYRGVIAQGCAGSWAPTTSRPGFAGPSWCGSGCWPPSRRLRLIPLALFLKKMIEKTFEGIAFAGFGFLITAAVLMLTAWLSRRDGTKGPAETTWLDALLDRPGPDVRPVAGSQPERADDRGRAGAWVCREPGPSASAC